MKWSLFGIYIFLLFINVKIPAKAIQYYGNGILENNTKSSTMNLPEKKTSFINVPYINQNEIVYGCEAVSATMLLQYYGYEISEKDFTNNYLIQRDMTKDENGNFYGPDPNAAFPGNPYLDNGDNCGFGIFASGLAESIDKILDTEKHETKNITGMNLEDIFENYINKGVPVLIYLTINMKQTSPGRSWIINYANKNSSYKEGDKFTWPRNEHCLVWVGKNGKKCYFNDPHENNGLIFYEEETVNSRFLEMGKQAVVVLEKKVEQPT